MGGTDLQQQVTLRAQEIGLRMAIGARRADVLRLIAGHAATLACLGGGAGLLAALAVTRWMSSLLYGIVRASSSGTAPPGGGTAAVR